MRLSMEKSLLEQMTIEQFGQNLALLKAEEIEMPKKWVLELLNTIEALQQENEQLQELAKAKAEGRLVVLPCKVGDRVYSIYGYLNKSIREDTVKHICVQDGEIRLTMDNTCTKIWERSAFATREEAEKAIGGGQDDSTTASDTP